MSAPTMHGIKLAHGDEVDLDTVPHCCDSEMTTLRERLYQCDFCSTVVDISTYGLVFDIR